MNNDSKCILVKEKLSFLIDFFFGELNMNDENLFKFGLSIVKQFIIGLYGYGTVLYQRYSSNNGTTWNTATKITFTT